MKAFTVVLALAGALVIGTAVQAVAQKSQDTLRLSSSEAESALDPYLQPGPFNNIWEPSIWDTLLSFDTRRIAFAPLLAKAWSQPSPTTYEYELRGDVKWQDGQAFDADDVVYTLNYLIDPKVNLRFKSNWAWLRSVEKLGPYKVRLTAKTPVPDGMMWMAFNTSIFPEHIHGPLADKSAFGAKPIGTGPLTVVRIDKNTGIVAEKNVAFKSTGAKNAAVIGRIVAQPALDAGTVVAKFLTGEIDVTRDMPPDQITALRENGRAEFTLAPPALGYSFIGFPSLGAKNVKALGDRRVRLAIIKAIDRRALIDATYGSIGKTLPPAEGLCSKEQLGCGYTKLVPEFDPAGARKLLADAGYPDGFDIAISSFPMSVPEVTAISGMLRAIGIRATVRTHPPSARLQQLAQGKIDIGYYGWNGGGMFEVSGQIARHFLSSEYDDAILTKMAEATGTMMDDAERRKAVAKVMDYANENAYVFPLMANRVIFTHTKDVKLLATDIRAGQVNPHEWGWK